MGSIRRPEGERDQRSVRGERDNSSRASGAVERALITIRVHPGASRAKVGELHAEPGHERVLGVWVTQRAVDGKATEAALDAVAGMLGVSRRAVRLVRGGRSRIKIIEVLDPPADLANRLTDA